jgi:hypothetical protein
MDPVFMILSCFLLSGGERLIDNCVARWEGRRLLRLASPKASLTFARRRGPLSSNSLPRPTCLTRTTSLHSRARPSSSHFYV